MTHDRIALTSDLQEVTYLNKNKSIAALPKWSLIKVSGPDSAHFLQGQLTCDVRTINPAHASFAAYLTPKGRVIATFMNIQIQEDYYLIVPQDNAENLLAALSKYARLSKVKLELSKDAYCPIGLTHLKDFPLLDGEVQAYLHGQVIKISESLSACIFLTAVEHIHQDWEDLASRHSIIHDITWDLLMIRTGMPWIQASNSDLFTVHDLDLHEKNAVSFKKGCFTGQEIVARMQYRGTLKQHLRHVFFPTANFEPNQVFYNEHQNEIARIVNIVYYNHSAEALIVLRDEHASDEYLQTDDGQHVAFQLIE